MPTSFSMRLPTSPYSSSSSTTPSTSHSHTNAQTQLQLQLHQTSLERRRLSNLATTKIQMTTTSNREIVKSNLLQEQANFRKSKSLAKNGIVEKAIRDTVRSPFLIDLVAENEKISEINEVRVMEGLRRSSEYARRKDKARDDIIMRALNERDDINLLRAEKRGIIVEERRLNALLDIERTGGMSTKAKGGDDRRDANRAEKWRKEGKREYRRRENREIIEERDGRKKEVVRIKHDIGIVEEARANAFNF